MFEINYSFQLNNSGETFQFNEKSKQIFTNSKSRIFEIRANNGEGKSFLIDLISFALELHSTEKISPQIKEKISRLGKSKNILSYQLKLNFPDGRILKLEKEEKQSKSSISIIENGAEKINIGANNLYRDVDILYDIPQDPLSRISLILKDINQFNQNFEINFANVYSALSRVVEHIENTRDNLKIKQYSQKENSIKLKLEHAKSELEKYVDLVKSVELTNSLEKIHSLKRSILELEKVKNLNKKNFDQYKNLNSNNTTRTKKLVELNDDIKKKEIQISSLITEYYLSKFKIYFEILNKSYVLDLKQDNSPFTDKITNIISNYQFAYEDQEKFKVLCGNINAVNKTIINSINSKNLSGNASRLKDSILELQLIIEAISIDQVKSDLISKELGIDIRDIKLKIETKLNQFAQNEYLSDLEFLTKFEKEISEFVNESYFWKIKALKTSKKDFEKLEKEESGIINDELTKGYLNYIDSSKNIDEFNIEIGKLKNIIIKLNPEEISSNFYISLDDLSYISSITKKYFNSAKTILKQLKIETPIEKSTLILQIAKREIIEKEKEIESLELEKLINQKNLEIESNKPTEEISDLQKLYIKKIFSFFDNSKSIARQISQRIKFNETGELVRIPHEGEMIEKNFLKIAGKMISKSLDNKIIWKESNFLELETYDILKGQFITKNGQIIEKGDLSVGQGSTTYLLQNIKKMKKNLNLIFLDEIAQIDSKNKNLIINEIKNINNENRLVLAIIIRPQEEGKEEFETIEIN